MAVLDTALVLQTQDNCPPGLIYHWATSRRVSLDVLRVDRYTELPDPREYACVFALGSSASLAGRRPDWVAREVEWIQRADAAGTAVLGICFGAQALAVALGGSVHRLTPPEFAWVELDTYDAERISRGPWLAVHEDRIALPPLAYELASNARGTQAFLFGRHLGVQFHPEATEAMLARWIADREEDLAPFAADLIEGARRRRPSAAKAAWRLFDRFAMQAGFAGPSLRPDRLSLA